MVQIWVAIITAVIAPCVVVILQRLMDRRNKQFKDMNMRMRRLEILMNINHNPEDAETILNLFDEYHKDGGNSYIQDRVQQWHTKHKAQHSPRRGKK